MKSTLLCSYNSRSNGGISTVVQQIGQHLNNLPIDISIVSCNDLFSDYDRHLYGDVRMKEYHTSSVPLLRHILYSKDINEVLEAEHPDVVDCQGIWLYFSKAAYNYQKKHPDTFRIVTPHGMLDIWAMRHSSWKKKIVGWLYENECLRTADCIHALCYSEYEVVRKYGLKNPVAIIPNGIDMPENPPINRNKEKKILLFISRIHPKKGLRELIQGISYLKSKQPNLLDKWIIRIAGWDQNGHKKELMELSNSLGVSEYISFIGPVFGEKKVEELCQADAFILPSFSEGLPMSILEAWAYRLPCVMTDYCNLPEGFSNSAAIHIEPNGDSISIGLRRLMKMSDEERISMGERGYALCKKIFSWEVIARKTALLYEYLLNGGEKPEFVYD